jgi:hypothetical protein
MSLRERTRPGPDQPCHAYALSCEKATRPEIWEVQPRPHPLFKIEHGIVGKLGVVLIGGESEMFTTKLNLVKPIAFAVVGITAALIEPALAQDVPVPAPIVGAGLPALVVIAGGYWLVRKFRRPR